jgi:hypothetical protein
MTTSLNNTLQDIGNDVSSLLGNQHSKGLGKLTMVFFNEVKDEELTVVGSRRETKEHCAMVITMRSLGDP